MTFGRRAGVAREIIEAGRMDLVIID